MSFKFEIPTFPTIELPVSRKTSAPSSAPLVPKATKFNPEQGPLGDPNASIYFIGTATTVIEWNGIRLLTDPNFLVEGDSAHLGPGVTTIRKTNPAVKMEELPRIDAVLLSHYHADHFDDKVEADLRRDMPIISTPHAHANLTSKPSPPFTAVHVLDHHEEGILTSPNSSSAIRIIAMPGKHVPPGPAGILEKVNALMGAIPPTNGWMVELGSWDKTTGKEGFETKYRIYITGDTLVIPELKEVAEKYKSIGGVDLMVAHLGGTTIPSKMAPLMMVTMDGKEGAEIMRIFDPKVTIPIHYDDYDLFLSDLDDFKKAVKDADLDKKNIVYLDRGDMFKFEVKA